MINDLFCIIDMEDEHQLWMKGRTNLSKELIKGAIEFKNVTFSYENRDKKALDGVNFHV